MRTQNYAGAGLAKPFHLQLFAALLCGLARAVSYACMAHSPEPCRPWSFQHEPWQDHFPEEGAVACWGRNPVSAKGVVHSQQTAFRATPHPPKALPERASLTGLWPWRWFSPVVRCPYQPVGLPISPCSKPHPSLVSLLTVLTAARTAWGCV